MPEFKDYLVIWEIDLKAESPREAAQQALEIQRDPESIATVFTVISEDFRAKKIDLMEE